MPIRHSMECCDVWSYENANKMQTAMATVLQ